MSAGGWSGSPYELCALVSLRDAIRRREIWVEGSRRWETQARRTASR